MTSQHLARRFQGIVTTVLKPECWKALCHSLTTPYLIIKSSSKPISTNIEDCLFYNLISISETKPEIMKSYSDNVWTNPGRTCSRRLTRPCELAPFGGRRSGRRRWRGQDVGSRSKLRRRPFFDPPRKRWSNRPLCCSPSCQYFIIRS